jgi:hypothetical protein
LPASVVAGSQRGVTSSLTNVVNICKGALGYSILVLLRAVLAVAKSPFNTLLLHFASDGALLIRGVL